MTPWIVEGSDDGRIWWVVNGPHRLTMPDAWVAGEVAAFYNRMQAHGYGIEVQPRLVGASWVDL